MPVRLTLTRAAAALALAVAALTSVRAQPEARRWVYLSTRPDEPADREPVADVRNVLLRPNVEEPLYVYVRNPTERAQDVAVILGASSDDSFARAEVVVPARTTVRVRPARPAPVATVPGGAPAPPPPATPLLAGLHLRLLDRMTNEELEKVVRPVSVQHPAQYVQPTAAFAGEPGTTQSRLVVTLRDRTPSRPFTGPPAKVRLDISPALIPGLIADSVSDGTFQGTLSPGGSATLAAANLRFRGPDRRGVVTVSVDGFDRAFLFATDFSGTVPQPMNDPALRLAGPRYAQPGKPCAIRLEVDNPPPAAVFTEFGIDLANTGEFATRRHTGDRSRTIGARWDSATAGLVIGTTVRDWVEELDTTGLSGSRRLRLHLLDQGGAVVAGPAYDTLVLDGTPPDNVQFGRVGRAIRDQLLDVTASGIDPESGVSRVLFFVGEPPAADGKPAPGGRVAEAVLAEPVSNVVTATAQLRLPERTGRTQIGVRFTNNVGLSREVTAEVVVAEPPPKPTTGTIKVKVEQGTPPRPQPGVKIELRDEKNTTVVTTGTSNEKGEYSFQEVAPGKYNVYADRPQFYVKAQKMVTVKAGATEDVTLTLVR